MKTPLPFSIIKRADRPSYLVSFKNEKTGAYMPPVSTRQTDEVAAIKTAWEWFRQGVPKKDTAIDIKQYALRNLVKEAGVADAQFIVNELKRRGFLKSAVLAGTRQDRDFAEYLTSFWDYDTSPYVKEKLRKNHGIHRRYCREQSGAVRRYWIPYFQGKLLGEITRQDVEAFIEYFETLPETKGIRIPKSAKRKNAIIQAGTIALSWAYNKEMIDRDVTGASPGFPGSRRRGRY
jgi:hypothetical protein